MSSSHKETSLILLILLFFLFFPQVSFVSSFSIVSCWIYWQDHWNKTKAMNNNVNNRGHRRDNNEEKPAHDRPLQFDVLMQSMK